MIINKRFVLSSSSKSRKSILRKIGLNFKSIKPNCDEKFYMKKLKKLNLSPKKISLRLAKIKAKETSLKEKNIMVVGSDTVINFQGSLFEKVGSIKEAAKTIKKLSGKKHKIISSAATYYNSKLIWSGSETTVVTMRKLNNKEIDEYLNICGPTILSSVGCYQIEKTGPLIIKEINGSFFNVMGFPLFSFLKFLKRTKKHEKKNIHYWKQCKKKSFPYYTQLLDF